MSIFYQLNVKITYGEIESQLSEADGTEAESRGERKEKPDHLARNNK